jgi:hypothetical protein
MLFTKEPLRAFLPQFAKSTIGPHRAVLKKFFDELVEKKFAFEALANPGRADPHSLAIFGRNSGSAAFS